MPAIAVVRVRGHAKIQHTVVDTMNQMKLNRPNHCVVLPETGTTKGMLQKVKDYVTWGEVNHELIARLLHQRGQVMGGDKLTDAYVKENSKFTSILSFAKALEKGEAKMSDVKGLKPVLRLPPPRQGYESTRKTFADHGAIGYRGDKIEKLIDRMLAKPSPTEAK
jgi:large subunit ribosomal protein L30